jgi:hypothetical protein
MVIFTRLRVMFELNPFSLVQTRVELLLGEADFPAQKNQGCL